MAKNGIDKLTATSFLDEIHHLLWIEPGANRGTWDEGWNCRDHAVLSVIVCQLLKMTGTIIYGEAMFVQGATDQSPPVGLHQTTHAWIGLDGLGFMDLSPRLTECRVPSWRSWPLQCIALSRCRPEGLFEYVGTPEDFDQRVTEATHSPGGHAIYLGQEYANVDSTSLETAFDFVDSPLSVKLSERFEPTVYAKAAIHLFRLVRGESKSLCHLSQDEAWETISKQAGNPVNWLKMKGGIR